MDRREFLKTAAVATVATSLGDKAALGADSFPYRTLGRSGEKDSGATILAIPRTSS